MNREFPWYDSVWLTHYMLAKDIIRKVKPAKLKEFIQAMEPLRTKPFFQVQQYDRIFSDADMARIRQLIRNLPKHVDHAEANLFGRYIARNLPLLVELQQALVPLVSKGAGEEVELSYNFLSLYTKLGVCPVHMDAPEAKYTLDVCIDQSTPWPIHFSQPQPWPETYRARSENWEKEIKQANRFTPYTLTPGKAVLFSGSSQWHYRDPIGSSGEHFCHLVFFHFVPKGTRERAFARNWPRLFDVPELSQLFSR